MADINYEQLQNYLANGTKELREFIKVNIYNGKSSEIDRVAKYYLFWKFYRGEHYRDFNDNMIAFNYVKAFIDKINHFLVGEESVSFKVARYDGDTVDEVVEKIIEKIILKNWRKNRQDILIHEILQMGSITGDCWVGVNWSLQLNCTKISCFDSRYCFPVFASSGIDSLSKFTVRQPIEKDNGGYTVLVTEYTNDRILQYKQKTSSELSYDKLSEQGDAEVLLLADVENKLGVIPVVHIKNKPSSEGYFGTSDASDIMKLNKVYNEVAQEMKVIVDYYTTPITIVTGATLKNAKRQIGNIWSGLPPEANVFTLDSQADLSGINEYMELLKKGMHEISDVPETVLGKTQAISGTSAAALKMTYQPLVHQASLKALTYGDGIIQINDLILAHYTIYGKKDSLYKELLLEISKGEFSDYRIEPIFSYGFPHDRMLTLQEFQMENQLNLSTRAHQMNRLGFNNVPELEEKIREQKIADAELNKEIFEITGQQEMSQEIPPTE